MQALRLCAGSSAGRGAAIHVRRSPHLVWLHAQFQGSTHNGNGRCYSSSIKPTLVSAQLQSGGEKIPISFNESTRPAYAHIPQVKLLSRAMSPPLSSIEIEVDGKKETLPAVFLRDSCSCEACVNHHSGQKRFSTAEIPSTIQVREARQLADASILLKWQNDHPKSAEGHTTRLFPSELLMKSPTPPVSLPAIWTRDDMIARFQKTDYSSFLRNEKEQHDVLVELLSHGLAFLRNVPKDGRSVEHIAERIGVVRETFYGRTWDVEDIPQAENVAYTNEFLAMHIDLTYMRYPPGFQVLHCMQNAGEGGESMFIDALHAARLVEEQSKDAFEALTTFPVTFHYTKGSNYYRDTKVTFETVGPWHRNLLETVRKQNLSRAYLISVVNWAPQFQGPFGVDIGLQEGAQKFRQYHEAAKMFADAVEAESNQFRYKMEPGDCAIFNNRRVMHGRTEFISSPKEARLLKGVYLDTDDILSRITDMERKLSS